MAKVLTVDDAASMREMVAFKLEENGHQVVQAENGEEGLKQALAQQFDLVISDVNMPIMDGFTMVAKIREQEQYKFTPILMLTTESGAEHKQKGKAAGATGWIVKPFDPDKFIQLVGKVLK